MTTIIFPKLFKKNSNGSSQEWTISVEEDHETPRGGVRGALITTRYGQVGGKIQEARDLITVGKNVGKANETSPLQQALAEAQSQFEKKKKAKGYVESLQDAKDGKVDDIIEGGVFPMLAHTFSKRGKDIKFPAYVQPKFDGHRCIAVIKDGKASLWTRTRKPITGLPHIIAQLEDFSSGTGVENIVLDGELFNEAYGDRFEELTSFIRNPDPKEGCEVVQYHIYDAVLVNLPFSERNDILQDVLRKKTKRPSLIPVETIEVADEDEMMLAFEKFLAQGYEGLMVRNKAGLYEENKRSAGLQKVKEFDSAEYEIIGVEAGRGKMADKAVFVCKTKDGTEFRVKMKGSLDSLKKYVDNPKLAIGKLLEVQYQGITNKSEVPRFPVGKCLRDDV